MMSCIAVWLLVATLILALPYYQCWASYLGN